MNCECGATFKTPKEEAKHRHNFPVYCKGVGTMSNLKHISDNYYKNQEYMIYQETEGDNAGLYCVDIRADDFDGAIIGGFEWYETPEEVATLAKDFIEKESGQ